MQHITTLQIRTFNTKDTEEVVALWANCKLTKPWNNPYKDIQRKLAVQADLFLVAEVNSVIVATIMAGYEGHRGWINYLTVSPDHQRNGYAKKMIQRIEEKLAEINCPKINIQIRDENIAAKGFYQSCGFSIDHSISMGKKTNY